MLHISTVRAHGRADIGNSAYRSAYLRELERRADPEDRRAKLVVTTDRGRAVMRLSDEIIGDIERRLAAARGRGAYEDFKKELLAVVDSLARSPTDERA